MHTYSSMCIPMCGQKARTYTAVHKYICTAMVIRTNAHKPT